MRNTLFFLSIMLAFMTSCNKDELYGGDAGAKSKKIRWYGTVPVAEEVQTKGVADGAKLWNQNAGVYIKFLNAPSDSLMIEKIKKTAATWQEYAGIKFHFVEADQRADVRIAFDWKGNDWLTWSYTGTDARFVRDQSLPTVNFGGLKDLDEKEFKGDVLRVFGQILGLEYEQRHQEWSKNGYWRDEEQLQKYWQEQFDSLDINWDEIRKYVFEPLTMKNATQLFETKQIDELSIMAWPYYTSTQTSKLLANYDLSEQDKTFIAQLYPVNADPKPENTLRTIQEAWVDYGYFEWVTRENSPGIWKEGMVALRITERGKQQDSLPDVSDGEQLTSVSIMFSGARKLLKAPKFNTSNLTDFSFMFAGCTSLKSIPDLDTSKGTNFASMFEYCSSLTSIPKLDTSKGTNFFAMFYRCTSLTSIPELNTSQGTVFAYMFIGCTSLKSIPKLHTSKGTHFGSMFYGCKSLQAKPVLDLSNAISTPDMYTGTPFA